MALSTLLSGLSGSQSYTCILIGSMVVVLLILLEIAHSSVGQGEVKNYIGLDTHIL